jgi:hypothetical protein
MRRLVVVKHERLTHGGVQRTAAEEHADKKEHPQEQKVDQ